MYRGMCQIGLSGVIGVPGDHIKGVIEDGKPVVYVNGKKLDEQAYINKYPLILVMEKVSL